MTTGDEYIRHTFAILFDVPADLAADQAVTKDVLNAAVSRITELIEADARLFRRATVALCGIHCRGLL